MEIRVDAHQHSLHAVREGVQFHTTDHDNRHKADEDIAIDVSKEADLRSTIREIEEEVEHTLLVATETIPFDIQVKVESLI